MDNETLPPLPEPYHRVNSEPLINADWVWDAYTAEQMRAFALAARAKLVELCDRLKLEAQTHAQEARTANATIAEIYQVTSGASGEPGNWHGAEPVKKKFAELTTRVQDLEQSAEVHARNMRDLVAEHVRERDALRADRDQCVKNMNDNAEHADKLSERVRELEQKLFESHTNPEWVRAIYDAGYTAQKECDALRAQLDAIQKQPTIEHVNSLGGVSLLIERPELP